jgi:DNA primase
MPADPAEEVVALRSLVLAGAGELRSGEQWQAWLYHAERFASLGFWNTMLIWAQRPEATDLHDYDGWKRLGRQVNRGEHGIRLIRRGRLTTVFDVSQTDGEPPSVVLRKRPEYDERVRPEAWRALGADGGDMAYALKLARQASRQLAGVDPAACQLTGLVEAESVAYLIALRLGLDPSGFSFPSVESWAGADSRAPVLPTIVGVAERVLTAFARFDTAVPERPVSGGRVIAMERSAPQVAAPAPILADAGRFFVSRAAESWGPGYLTERGFGAQLQAQWRLGYAPDGWTSLTAHLRELGYGDREIEAAGLAKRSGQGTLIDVFRDRIMFPVRLADGTVAGFIGRAGPDASADVPKYLNTRETALYRKGEVLFGLHEGSALLTAGARPVIVEGPLDAIAVTSATDGAYVGVAPCGTALTAMQVGLLGCRSLVLAFDGDQAGAGAAVRAYDVLRECDVQAVVASFPAGQDPAGLLRASGAPELVRVLRDSTRPLLDMVIDAKVARFDRWLEFLEGKFNALHAVAPLIASGPADDVGRQVTRVADLLGLNHAEVTAAVTEAVSPPVTGRAVSSPRASDRRAARRDAPARPQARRAG